ncbi:MAG TPA: hypothetical protein VMT99_04170 [Candidatus Paceibacterota bacterium]|nr:hypothetical protein [Candidatus Paceibacterota bacterium]
MSELIHADIFFFVTTIVVIVVGATLTVALIYLSRVLSDVKVITEQVREETVLVRTDVKDLRDGIRREGFRIERFLAFFKSIAKRRSARARNARSKS